LVEIGIGVDPPLKLTGSLSDASGFTVVDSDTEDEEVTGIAVGVVLSPVIETPEGVAVLESEVGRGARGLEESAGEVESEREARESREC
jgi:hypothetical protein